MKAFGRIRENDILPCRLICQQNKEKRLDRNIPFRVDSTRYVDGLTRRMVKRWIEMEQPRSIPWTPLTKPLKDCRISLLSSAGIALKTDQPFDQDRERQNPWWGDPTLRRIPRQATEQDIMVYHLHINSDFVRQDLNCLLPLQRLAELVETGEIGSIAETHYSVMGYILQPEQLLSETGPAIVGYLRQEAVDVLVLVPA
jgi:D-proline reductase (dithiol) PrdB